MASSPSGVEMQSESEDPQPSQEEDESSESSVRTTSWANEVLLQQLELFIHSPYSEDFGEPDDLAFLLPNTRNVAGLSSGREKDVGGKRSSSDGNDDDDVREVGRELLEAEISIESTTDDSDKGYEGQSEDPRTPSTATETTSTLSSRQSNVVKLSPTSSSKLKIIIRQDGADKIHPKKPSAAFEGASDQPSDVDLVKGDKTTAAFNSGAKKSLAKGQHIKFQLSEAEDESTVGATVNKVNEKTERAAAAAVENGGPLIEPWYGYDYEPTGPENFKAGDVQEKVSPSSGEEERLREELLIAGKVLQQQKKKRRADFDDLDVTSSERKLLSLDGEDFNDVEDPDNLFRLSSEFEKAWNRIEKKEKELAGDEGDGEVKSSRGSKEARVTYENNAETLGEDSVAIVEVSIEKLDTKINDSLADEGTSKLVPKAKKSSSKNRVTSSKDKLKGSLSPHGLTAQLHRGGESGRPGEPGPTDQSDPDTASAAALLSSASSALSAIEGRALSATTIGVRLGDANETDELGQIEQSFRRALIRFSFMFWVGWTAVRYYCAGRTDTWWWSTPSVLCGPKSSAFWLALGVPAIFGTSFVLVAFYEATIRLFLRIFLWLAGVTYSVRTRIGEAFDQAQEIASQTALAGSNIAEAVQEAVSRGSVSAATSQLGIAGSNPSQELPIGEGLVGRDIRQQALPPTVSFGPGPTEFRRTLPNAAADVPATIITTSQFVPYDPNKGLPCDIPSPAKTALSSVAPPTSTKKSRRQQRDRGRLGNKAERVQPLTNSPSSPSSPSRSPSPAADRKKPKKSFKTLRDLKQLRNRIGNIKSKPSLDDSGFGDRRQQLELKKTKRGVLRDSERAALLYKQLEDNEKGASKLRKPTTLRLSKKSPTHFVPIIISQEPGTGKICATIDGVRQCKSEPNIAGKKQKKKQLVPPPSKQQPQIEAPAPIPTSYITPATDALTWPTSTGVASMVPTRALNDTAVIFSPPGFAVYNNTTTSQPSKDQSRVFNAHPVGGDASSVLVQSKIAVANNKQEEEPAVRSSLFGGAGSLSNLRRGYSESSVDVLSKKRDAISGKLKRASVDSCRHNTDEKKFFSLPNKLFSWLARKQASRVKNK